MMVDDAEAREISDMVAEINREVKEEIARMDREVRESVEAKSRQLAAEREAERRRNSIRGRLARWWRMKTRPRIPMEQLADMPCPFPPGSDADL